MSEESVMKQALSPETPARVRRIPFRAITLGLGFSAFALACSFGEIDNGPQFEDITPPGEQTTDPTDDPGSDQGDPGDNFVDPPSQGDPTDEPDPNYDEDMFKTEIGKTVKEILETNCAGCHFNGVKSGNMDYVLDFQKLLDNKKVVPGNKEDSQLFVRMQQQSMPPAFMRDQRPTFGQIELVGQWIDEMEGLFEDKDALCTGDEGKFVSLDDQIAEMADDIAAQDAEDQPFIRYLTISYSNNAGDCGRALQRQRYALFKGINSVSTDTNVHEPEAIDDAKLIYRIDIRDYGWDRPIDLEDDDVVDFDDAWLAILDGVGNYAIEFQGDEADDLKADAQVNVPFLPVNAFIQFTEQNDLYYALINARNNLFDFEREVLLIDTVAEIDDNNLMRAGFSNSGVSKQDRVLNRFDSGIQSGYSYWISFDFDGGNGNGGVNGVSNGFEQNVANESIFQDPLGFAFAGGEAIFSLPNGMQAYYVAAANGQRLNEAPVGVVIDPAQNNGLVTNGASCHSCHNAGLIAFQDMVKDYVIDNKVQYDNETYEDVLEQYPDDDVFQRQMDLDSEMHIAAAEKAGVPRGTPDPVSRVYLDFQLRLTPEVAAGDLQIPLSVLESNYGDLDERLTQLGTEGRVDRQLFTDLYFDTMCVFHTSSDNQPVGCP
jgi:serine/threonine-protein kinase